MDIQHVAQMVDWSRQANGCA